MNSVVTKFKEKKERACEVKMEKCAVAGEKLEG